MISIEQVKDLAKGSVIFYCSTSYRAAVVKVTVRSVGRKYIYFADFSKVEIADLPTSAHYFCTEESCVAYKRLKIKRSNVSRMLGIAQSRAYKWDDDTLSKFIDLLQAQGIEDLTNDFT